MKKYILEEFAFEMRSRFGVDNNFSDIFLAKIFLAKCPIVFLKN